LKYSIDKIFLVNDKIWFTIRFYASEGYEGIGGIGYFDYKRRKIGIASFPEIVDHSISDAVLIGKRFFIALFDEHEYGPIEVRKIIEFNTLDCSYRIYTFRYSLFTNFTIENIWKLDDKILAFYTGNEIVFLNTENYEWKRFSLYCEVKNDSAPLFLESNSDTDAIYIIGSRKNYYFSKKIIKYCKKGERFFPVYFTWYQTIEVISPYAITGIGDFSPYLYSIISKRTTMWDSRDVDEAIFIQNKKYGNLKFYYSPIISMKKIKKSYYKVKIKGAYLDLSDVDLILKKTAEKIIPPPEWKTFSDSPFEDMEKEVGIMKSDYKKDPYPQKRIIDF